MWVMKWLLCRRPSRALTENLGSDISRKGLTDDLRMFTSEVKQLLVCRDSPEEPCCVFLCRCWSRTMASGIRKLRSLPQSEHASSVCIAGFSPWRNVARRASSFHSLSTAIIWKSTALSATVEEPCLRESSLWLLVLSMSGWSNTTLSCIRKTS